MYIKGSFQMIKKLDKKNVFKQCFADTKERIQASDKSQQI